MGILAVILIIVMMAALFACLCAKHMKNKQKNKLDLFEASRKLYNQTMNTDGDEEEEAKANTGLLNDSQKGTLDEDEPKSDEEEGKET